MLHHREGIVATKLQPACLQFQRFHGCWKVNVLVGDLSQFGKIAPDKLAIRIESLRLRHRIEDSEPGLGIATGRCRPLPAAIVCSQVVVIQMLGKKVLPPGAVDAWAAAGSVDTDLSLLSFLELYGTEIAERRMPARRVVEALDVIEHI